MTVTKQIHDSSNPQWSPEILLSILIIDSKRRNIFYTHNNQYTSNMNKEYKKIEFRL